MGASTQLIGVLFGFNGCRNIRKAGSSTEYPCDNITDVLQCAFY